MRGGFYCILQWIENKDKKSLLNILIPNIIQHYFDAKSLKTVPTGKEKRMHTLFSFGPCISMDTAPQFLLVYHCQIVSIITKCNSIYSPSSIYWESECALVRKWVCVRYHHIWAHVNHVICLHTYRDTGVNHANGPIGWSPATADMSQYAVMKLSVAMHWAEQMLSHFLTV